MAELLEKAVMLEILRDLKTAFPQRMTDDDLLRRATVYRDALVGYSGEAIRMAARRSIQEDQYFPKVARLRELARAWAEYEQRSPATPLLGDPDPLWCERCRSMATWRLRWRPAVTRRVRSDEEPNGHTDFRAWLVSQDGQWLLLEQYERLLCECAAPCSYFADPHMDPPAMRISGGNAADLLRLPAHQRVRHTTITVQPMESVA